MSKIVKLVFLASLVLNVLLVGVLLGRLPRDVGFGRQQRIEQALKDLPEPTQTRFREKFKQLRAAGDPLCAGRTLRGNQKPEVLSDIISGRREKGEENEKKKQAF